LHSHPSPNPPQTLPKALGPKARKLLQAALEWLLPPCLRFVRKGGREMSPTQDAALARAAMRVVGTLLGAAKPAAPAAYAAPIGSGPPAPDAGAAGGQSCVRRDVEEERDTLLAGLGEEEDAAASQLASMDEAARVRLAEAAAVFAVVWGVGGSADSEGRAAFDAFLRWALFRRRGASFGARSARAWLCVWLGRASCVLAPADPSRPSLRLRRLLAGGVPEGFEALLPPKPGGLAQCPALPEDGSVYDFVWDAKADQGKGGCQACSRAQHAGKGTHPLPYSSAPPPTNTVHPPSLRARRPWRMGAMGGRHAGAGHPAGGGLQ
jgi:hypothetical protein